MRGLHWAKLLDLASDDESIVFCVAALARLGVWAPQADDVIHRGLLTQDMAEALRSVYRAKSAHAEEGLAKLRELAAQTVLAAIELVLLLAEDVGHDAAISECERQLQHWHHARLSLLHVDLLGRNGKFEQAAAMIEKVLPDQAIPAEIRVQLGNWLVNRKSASGDYAGAVIAARATLRIGQDPDLIWNYVGALFNVGAIQDARGALAQYQPTPQNANETRLWAELHRGVSISPDDAETLISLARMYPAGAPAGAVIPMVYREAALVRKDDCPYPPRVIDALSSLATEVSWPHRLLSDDPEDDAIRQIPIDNTSDQDQVDTVIAAIRQGNASQSDLAATMGRPYGAVLIHRAAGVLPVADLSPTLRADGEAAARRALDQGRCVADLSAIHMTAILPDGARDQTRIAVPDLMVPRRAALDATLTRDHVRTLAAGQFTASLSADGTVMRHRLSDSELAQLEQQAAELETICNRAAVGASKESESAARDANTRDLRHAGLHEAVIWDFALVWTRRGLPVRVGCRSPPLSRSPCAFLSA